jgi:opacity protein-like surface antigen
MKKFFTLALLALSTASFGQFRAGIKLAPTIAYTQIDGSDFNTDGVKVRFSAGLITEIGFTENYSLVTGVEVLNLGAKFSYDGRRNAYTTYEGDNYRLINSDVTLNYVNIPLHFRMTTNDFGSLKYFASLGADLGVLTRARSKDNIFRLDTIGNPIQTRFSREEHNVDDEWFILRVGINVGAGIIYNIAGNTDLVVGVNWMNGILNGMRSDSKGLRRNSLPEDDGNDQSYRQNATTNAVMITVGVMF